jgi:hypothetical protein
LGTPPKAEGPITRFRFAEEPVVSIIAAAGASATLLVADVLAFLKEKENGCPGT